MTGEMGVVRAIYAAAALYFVNPVTDTDNPLILIAKFMALVVTTGVVLSILGSAVSAIGHFLYRIGGKASVVYGDSEEASLIEKSLHRGYRVEEPKSPEKVKSHFICFAEDTETLRFYQANKDEFEGEVYLIMRSVEPYLLADTSNSNIHVLSLSDLMARRFLREHLLYDSIVKEHNQEKIAIIGYGVVGAALFRAFYLNHIYSTAQYIEYHIWEADEAARSFIETLITANDDKIILHEKDWICDHDLISEMTQIFVCDGCDIDTVQKLLRIESSAQIYVYGTEGIEYEGIYNGDKLHTFGDISEILTEAYIKDEPLDRAAKLLNYDYELRYSGQQAPYDYMDKAEEKWRTLNGFFRGSNTARADHHYIEKRLMDDGTDDVEICMVEHVRWCRYYYYNGWKYAPVRDNAKRHHTLLVPFEDLSDEEKSKDGVYDPVLKKEIDRCSSLSTVKY